MQHIKAVKSGLFGERMPRPTLTCVTESLDIKGVLLIIMVFTYMEHTSAVWNPSQTSECVEEVLVVRPTELWLC